MLRQSSFGHWSVQHRILQALKTILKLLTVYSMACTIPLVQATEQTGPMSRQDIRDQLVGEETQLFCEHLLTGKVTEQDLLGLGRLKQKIRLMENTGFQSSCLSLLNIAIVLRYGYVRGLHKSYWGRQLHNDLLAPLLHYLNHAGRIISRPTTALIYSSLLLSALSINAGNDYLSYVQQALYANFLYNFLLLYPLNAIAPPSLQEGRQLEKLYCEFFKPQGEAEAALSLAWTNYQNKFAGNFFTGSSSLGLKHIFELFASHSQADQSTSPRKQKKQE